MRALILRSVVFPLAVTALAAAGCSGEIANLPTTATPVPVTETFSGELNKNGAATHSFFTGATGTVTATLTSLGDNPPSKVGLSMGTMSGSTCTIILRNDNAVVTSLITGTVSTLQGSLCVSIYDVGAVPASAPVPYTITVVHP